MNLREIESSDPNVREFWADEVTAEDLRQVSLGTGEVNVAPFWYPRVLVGFNGERSTETGECRIRATFTDDLEAYLKRASK